MEFFCGMNTEELKSKFRIPVIASPMFIVSGTEMALECCKNGIVGSFPSLNGRTNEAFEKMLKEMHDGLERHKKETGKEPMPYAVNLIVNQTNPRLMPDLETCIKYKVPIVITSLGAVKEVVDAVHSYGGMVFHDIIKKRHAEKAAEAGVDGIICVSAGAGGHAGRAHPFALINEVKRFYNGLIIMAGSISTGREILAAQIAGANLVYMGTRFIATEECLATEGYKQMILDSGIDDLIYTDGVSGVHANFLIPSIEKAGIDLDEKKKEDFSKLTGKHAKAWKDIWSAGQGITEIHDIPKVSNLIERLEKEYEEAIEKIVSLQKKHTL